jgi:prepilin-type N-terminal cleavage/methylation domain-containing protein
MSPLRGVLRDERGFTLTELLVVTAVLGLILAAVVVLQQRGQEAYLFGSHRVEVQQNNRAALELMVRELRSANSITAIPSATNLTFADENNVPTLNMTYFSAWNGATNTGTTTTTPASVKLIRVQLVTGTEDQVSSSSPGNQRATMESLVRLRNIP